MLRRGNDPGPDWGKPQSDNRSDVVRRNKNDNSVKNVPQLGNGEPLTGKKGVAKGPLPQV